MQKQNETGKGTKKERNSIRIKKEKNKKNEKQKIKTTNKRSYNRKK